MNLKVIVIKLLGEYEDGKFSNLLLNEFFFEEGASLSKKERGFVTEVFYGVIRNIIFLDYQIDKRSTKKVHRRFLRNLLRISFYQSYFMRSDDAGIAWEGTELAKEKLGDYVGNFVNAIIRRFLVEMEDEKELLLKDNDLGTLYSYPQWFIDKAEMEVGKENLEDLLISYKTIPYTSIRRNPLKISHEDLLEKLQDEGVEVIHSIDNRIYYLSSGYIVNSRLFKDGYISIQDGASYLSSKFLNGEKGDLILDACSAPGTKATSICEDIEDNGEIIALDIHKHKMRLIKRGSKRLGLNSITPIKLDACEVASLEKTFDKVLVDAPCSGLGILRKKPEVIYKATPDSICELASLQRNILDATSKVLKVGGTLVYSTCTVFSTENTENIKSFLDDNKNFQVEDITIPEGVVGSFDSLGGFKVTYEDEFLDSFYLIKLKKIKEV